MPTQPPPQPSAPAPSEKPAREGTLFHLLVERGWDEAVAYTADQQIYTMTSETVAGSLQPVLEELRHMRETMAGFATKEDLAGFATKADMAMLEARLLKWMFGAMLAQTAVIVGFVVGVVPLLK